MAPWSWSSRCPHRFVPLLLDERPDSFRLPWRPDAPRSVWFLLLLLRLLRLLLLLLVVVVAVLERSRGREEEEEEKEDDDDDGRDLDWFRSCEE